MNLILILLNISLLVPMFLCILSINQIEMRPPKQEDIGLIFDVNVINTADKEKATLDLRIRGESCCIETICHNKILCNIPKLFGGYFGQVEPGSLTTVSVIWPTTVLYNRKGYCDLVVFTTTNTSIPQKEISHRIIFDTHLSLDKIPPIMETYIIDAHLTSCETIDLNPFKNCTPINCEEKYFGQRSYFDFRKNLCLVVPNCTGANMIYSFISNECLDSTKLVTNEDIKMVKDGKFNETGWEPKTAMEFSDDEADSQFYYNPDEEETGNRLPESDESKFAGIRWGILLDGIIIAIATICIYLLVCFLIFLMVSINSKRLMEENKYKTYSPKSQFTP